MDYYFFSSTLWWLRNAYDFTYNFWKSGLSHMHIIEGEGWEHVGLET